MEYEYFILFFLYIFFSSKKKENFTIVSNDNVIIKKHDVYGRTIYANKDYNINDIIEVCPTLSDDKSNFTQSIIKDYLFQCNQDKSVLSLGYCGLYNHRDDNNASWIVADDNSTVTVYAIKDIKKGEEIMVNYGNGYWTSRPQLNKV